MKQKCLVYSASQAEKTDIFFALKVPQKWKTLNIFLLAQCD